MWKKICKWIKTKVSKVRPAAKAARMTESQRRSAVARKRSKPQGVGGKPTKRKNICKKKKHGIWEEWFR